MAEIQHLPNISFVSSDFSCEISLSRFNRQYDEAQQWLGDRVLEDNKPFMPFLTGNLQQRSYVMSRGVQVVFPGPAARFLYMGKVMVDEVTGSPWARPGAKKVVTSRPLTYSSPSATAHWFDAAKAANGEYWINGVKRIAGGG